MNKIKKISIIVLTYNNWKYLKTSIGSIADQNLIDLEFEIIVSDDGTKDFDKEFVENILKENNLFDKTKIVINKKNIGTVKSFNNAIKLSTGDVIIPLSSDDYFYDSKVINDIVTFFNKNNNALILTGLQIPFDNQKEYQPIISKDKYPLFKSSKSLIRYITLRNNIISGASTYYRKSIFDKYGLFDEGYKLLEDYPFYIKLLSNNCPIYLLNRKVIKYKLGGYLQQKK